MNIGKSVQRKMKRERVSKLHLSKLLKISRPTLDNRLKDGEFTYSQVLTLKENNLL